MISTGKFNYNNAELILEKETSKGSVKFYRVNSHKQLAGTEDETMSGEYFRVEYTFDMDGSEATLVDETESYEDAGVQAATYMQRLY